jgi:hypothetical protein
MTAIETALAEIPHRAKSARRVMNMHERNGLRALALRCFQKLRARERAKFDAGQVPLNDYWNKVEAFQEALQKLDATLSKLARGDKDFRPVPDRITQSMRRAS